MRRYRTTAKKLLFLLVALVTVLAFVFVLLSGRCSIMSNSPDGTSTEPQSAPEIRHFSNIDNAPTDRDGVRCPDTGLAAVDLAGNCRATPRATMGALEAVDK